MENSSAAENWHEWRRQGVGSSDIAAIVGLSPYRTIFDVWLEKTRRSAGKEQNFAMSRGLELEPVARELYEQHAGAEFPPATLVSRENEIFRASFDGLNVHLRRAIEIKCPCREDHEAARSGKVPLKYWPQVQWLLLVAGKERAETLDYVSFDGKSEIVVVPVSPDAEYQRFLAQAAMEFWTKYVETDTPPPGLLVLDCADTEELAREYIETKREIAHLSTRAESILAKISERIGDAKKVMCRGYAIDRVERKGAIDYKRALESIEHKLDLEQFRREKIVSISVKELQK